MSPTMRSSQGNTITVPKAAVEFYTSKGWQVAGPTRPPESAPEIPEEVLQGTPAGVPEDSWTVKQLTDLAERESIDLGTATKKADVLAAISAGKKLVDDEDAVGEDEV